MSRCVVPISSTSAPAILLSARRELVPETIRKSPARLTCGYFPRGFAFPSTTLLSTSPIAFATVINSDSEPDTDVVQFRIKVQRVHAPFAPDSRQPHTAKGRAQIPKKPAVHPSDPRIHLLCDAVAALQI